MNITIYHNPRCSKSRQTLALLQEHGFKPTIIEYLKTPPSVEVLHKITQWLDKTPREIMRRRESIYQTLNLDNPDLTDQDLLKAMHDNPILIERPIVVVNNKKARIGRPPEAVLLIVGHSETK